MNYKGNAAVAGAHRLDLISAALYHVSTANELRTLILAKTAVSNKSHEIHFRCV